MAMNFPIQANFTRGELTPKMHARIDVDHYKAGAALCENYVIMREGGLRRRGGFKMVKEIMDSSAVGRLMPFIFGTLSTGPQAYVVELGNLKARFLTNGGIITSSTKGGTPTAITKANPAVVTITAHGLNNGDKVWAIGIGGMTELNNREFTVANKTANTFELSGINSTSYGTFTSGGSIRLIVELVTPYPTADLALIDYAQSADTLLLTHASYQPVDVTRTADDAWTKTNPSFLDGPYLDEPDRNGNGIVPSITNCPIPKMTSNTAPSGTVTESGGNVNAYSIFDRVNFSSWYGNASGYIRYVFPGGTTAVVDHYVVIGPRNNASRAPNSWTISGYDGTNWIALDQRYNQISWGGGEQRFFEFLNTVAFQGYEFAWSGNSGDPGTEVGEVSYGYNGDYAPTMTLTFDSTTNVNNGAGFDSGDIGRTIRMRGSDSKWRWFLITGVTSTTVVTGRMYGYALPDTDKIYRWKLGAWRGGQWPAKVGFFQARRAHAKSNKEPYGLWLSKAFDFLDFGTSDPLTADDGIRQVILSGQLTSIAWLAESDKLTIGSLSNIRQAQQPNKNEGYGATNQDQQLAAFDGAMEGVKPVNIGSVILFPDYYKQAIREFVYEINQDGYTAPEISVLSRHLLKSGIVDMAFQKQPDAILWIVTTAGHLVAMTYEREQKILGFTKVSIAGGDPGTAAVVESVCTIPGSMRTEVYIIVKRTIGGATKRYIEQLSSEFDDGDDVATCNFLDSSLQYNGTATGTVTGLPHLAGLTVDVLADKIVYRGLTVSATGTVTLPASATAAKWTIGLRYKSKLRTLPLSGLGLDGVKIGRRISANEVYLDCLSSYSLKINGIKQASSPSQSQYFNIFKRDSILDTNPNYMAARTGVFHAKFDASTADRGQFEVWSDDPLPAMVRALVIGNDGEP